jgi:hypothetical protein
MSSSLEPHIVEFLPTRAGKGRRLKGEESQAYRRLQQRTKREQPTMWCGHPLSICTDDGNGVAICPVCSEE